MTIFFEALDIESELHSLLLLGASLMMLGSNGKATHLRIDVDCLLEGSCRLLSDKGAYESIWTHTNILHINFHNKNNQGYILYLHSIFPLTFFEFIAQKDAILRHFTPFLCNFLAFFFFNFSPCAFILICHPSTSPPYGPTTTIVFCIIYTIENNRTKEKKT